MCNRSHNTSRPHSQQPASQPRLSATSFMYTHTHVTSRLQRPSRHVVSPAGNDDILLLPLPRLPPEQAGRPPARPPPNKCIIRYESPMQERARPLARVSNLVQYFDTYCRAEQRRASGDAARQSAAKFERSPGARSALRSRATSPRFCFGAAYVS